MADLEIIARVMHFGLERAIASIDGVDDRIEMEFILGQFYAGHTDKDEVARGIITQLRVHRCTQHKHCWALAANKETWK